MTAPSLGELVEVADDWTTVDLYTLQASIRKSGPRLGTDLVAFVQAAWSWARDAPTPRFVEREKWLLGVASKALEGLDEGAYDAAIEAVPTVQEKCHLFLRLAHIQGTRRRLGSAVEAVIAELRAAIPCEESDTGEWMEAFQQFMDGLVVLKHLRAAFGTILKSVPSWVIARLLLRGGNSRYPRRLSSSVALYLTGSHCDGFVAAVHQGGSTFLEHVIEDLVRRGDPEKILLSVSVRLEQQEHTNLARRLDAAAWSAKARPQNDADIVAAYLKARPSNGLTVLDVLTATTTSVREAPIRYWGLPTITSAMSSSLLNSYSTTGKRREGQFTPHFSRDAVLDGLPTETRVEL